MSAPVSATTPAGSRTAARPVVVGIDSARGRSTSALVWAVEQAQQSGAPLRLVTAVEEIGAAAHGTGVDPAEALAHRLTLEDVDRATVTGRAVDVLLEEATHAAMIVVGCRAMGRGERMVMGSTSRAVACWSPVPVVVVPEAWMQPGLSSAPVVAGIRPSENGPDPQEGPDDEVLDFAFSRASALRVPLFVVSAFQPPLLQTWSPADLSEARTEHDSALEARLSAWQERFPDVDVVATSAAEPAHHAVLEASRLAQLVVVGRHHAGRLSGLLGGTVRKVLRETSRPVVVVPHGPRHQLVAELVDRGLTADPPWAPTF